MLILGIETSCDETSVAVVEDGVRVLSNVISSSKAAFERLAGVIPEQAARRQIECVVPVLRDAMEQAKVSWKQIDAIAVTKGPGLMGSLLVGTATARVLAAVHKKPLIGVHHTLGHLVSTFLENGLVLGGTKSRSNEVTKENQNPSFPLLTLSVSGGHTDLWYRTSPVTGTLLGRTRDDAAGEAFDKGASMLGLPYPGGPSVSKTAEGGDEKRFPFPMPLHDEPGLDFSCSGLKTSLKYLLRDQGVTDPASMPQQLKADIAASFQYGICRHLLDRTTRAIEAHPDAQELHIVGGVSANSRLRTMAAEVLKTIPVRVPATLAYCTDNAAMIAAAGYFLLKEHPDRAQAPFATSASLPLEQSLIEDGCGLVAPGERRKQSAQHERDNTAQGNRSDE